MRSVRNVTSVTVKIPGHLNNKLGKTAARKYGVFPETIRRALPRELKETKGFAALATPFYGMFSKPSG
jgi:hypothetical protein